METATEWGYTVDSATGDATITGYSGSDSTLSIPDNIEGHTVTAIGERAFYYDRTIQSVRLPGTVTSIDSCAFYGCDNLSTVTFGEGLQEIGECAFKRTGIVSANLPEGLTKLGNGVFFYCAALTRAYIPGTLESAGSYNYGVLADAPSWIRLPLARRSPRFLRIYFIPAPA